MRKLISLIIFSLFLPMAAGNSIPFVYAQSIELPQEENSNLELHVTTDENVDIKVFIDGKLVADEQFRKRQEKYNLGIAPHKVFRFKLEPGKHILSAEAHQGAQSFTGEFELSNKRWISLCYVDPRRIKQKEPFSLEIYDHQIRYQ